MMLQKQGSFVDQVALNSKTDKLFGLDKQDNSLRPQKEGYLIKKPFKSGSSFKLTSDKLSRKRWFAVKDSFLFWWDNEPKAISGFDTHPKAAVPLGGASITLMPDKLTMVLRHPIFQTKGDSIEMKAADWFEAQEWLSVIQAGMKATWENAILGFALIEKLKAKGSELETEKEEALVQAQREAERLEAEREEAQRLADLKAQQAALHEEEVAKVAGTVGELQKQMSIKEDEHHKEKEAYEEEKRRREMLERELLEAQDALMEIEAAFEAFEEHRLREMTKERLRQDNEARKRQPTMRPPTEAEQAEFVKAAEEAVKASADAKFKDEAQVRKNVAALREYFEATARTHELRRQGLGSKSKSN